MIKPYSPATLACLSAGFATLSLGMPTALSAEATPAPVAPAEKAAPEKSPTAWTGNIAAGVSLTSGNSDTVSFNTTANATKKWEMNELSLGGYYTYGETDSDLTTSIGGAQAQYNRLFSDRFYGYGRVGVLHDGVAGVKYRLPVGVGVGYYFIKNDKFTLSGEVGPGWVWQRVGDVDENFFTIMFSEKGTWKISDRARVFEQVTYTPQVTDWGNNYAINSQIGLETDITKHITLNVMFVDNYLSQPAEGRQPNDLQLIAGVGYKF